MGIKHWWTSVGKDERQRVAEACGTKAIYLYQIVLGVRRPGPRLAVDIERATNGAVTRAELRPDIFDAPTKRPKAAA